MRPDPRQHSWIVALGLVVFGTAAAASGESGDGAPSLEDLLKQGLRQVPAGVEVSTASRFSQSAQDAPATTFVVTAEDIRLFGMRNLTDILRSLPGLYVTSNGDFVFVGARGLGRPGDYNSRLLLMVDGVRMNENTADAAQIGAEFQVDIDAIERVEYTPGPGSALYGSNAFLGVINVILKRADKLDGWRLRAAADSPRGGEMALSYGHRTGDGSEFWIEGSAQEHSRIEFPLPVPAAVLPGLQDRNWEQAQHLMAGVNVGGWSLRAGASERTRGFPASLDNEPGGLLTQELSVVRNAYASLGYEGPLTPSLDVSGNLSFFRADSDIYVPVVDENGANQVFSSDSFGRWMHLDLHLGSAYFDHHYLTGGLDYQKNFIQLESASLLGQSPFQYFVGYTARWGLYLQDEWKLSDAHLLVLGLRRDVDAQLGGPVVSPRVAWVWHVLPRGDLKLAYGSAYRSIDLNEYGLNAGQEAPIPEAEHIHTLNLSWEQAWGPQFSYQLTLYHSRIDDLISLSPEYPIYINSPHIESTGVELSAERRWDDGGKLQLAASWQRTRTDAGEPLLNSPTALLKLGYSHPLGAGWLLAWQIQAMSRRGSTAGLLPAYGISNLNLIRSLGRDVELSLAVHNVCDQTYFDSPLPGDPPLRQEGRSLRLQLSWRFGS